MKKMQKMHRKPYKYHSHNYISDDGTWHILGKYLKVLMYVLYLL